MDIAINVLFVVVVAWFAYSRFGKVKGLRTLQATDFRRELETGSTDMLLIDVREAGEYRSGYIPGARNIPLSQLGSRLGELPTDKQLLLYCRSGMRSKTAARQLMRGGYSQIAHLQGGLGAWSGKLVQ
ncbi:rhodanese-like domain-containing protein [Paenibacillus sp. CF384]|uniref:rhodanese-like domain-containing protein n=1 Tax=Paenibacillus sp. CF384 TaxID=1884382 RepID=UPI00089C6338|nr:rhodanese-like domain-containing protein [Paenibacillus sp. CF384]SDW95797.1 Rhodanese-related sulfurtransferase [Paenibacillus sp. CF384]